MDITKKVLVLRSFYRNAIPVLFEIGKAIKNQPDSLERLVDIFADNFGPGIKLSASGNLQQGIGKLEKVVAEGPEIGLIRTSYIAQEYLFYAYGNYAVELEGQENIEDALTFYEKAYTTNPRGFVLGATQAEHTASILYQKLLQLNWRLATRLVEQGNIFIL